MGLLEGGGEIQFFATICEDTGDNAIYIHTENPNGTEFPAKFENTDWVCEVPLELVVIVDMSTYEIGKTQYSNEVGYVLRKKVLG